MTRVMLRPCITLRHFVSSRPSHSSRPCRTKRPGNGCCGLRKPAPFRRSTTRARRSRRAIGVSDVGQPMTVFDSVAVICDRSPLDVRRPPFCVRLQSLRDNPLGPVAVRVVLIFEPDMLNVRWPFLGLHRSIVHPHLAAYI